MLNTIGQLGNLAINNVWTMKIKNKLPKRFDIIWGDGFSNRELYLEEYVGEKPIKYNCKVGWCIAGQSAVASGLPRINKVP